MNQKKLRIGIDMDDVLWDLVGAWLQRHNEINDDNVKPQDIKTWDIASYLNKGSKESLFYILRQNDFWRTVEPLDDSIKYLQMLMERDDVDVFIVTATDYRIVTRKMSSFFDKFPFIKHQQLIITYRKNAIDLDVIVDDNPEHVCDAPSGCIKVLFDRPHNRWCAETGIGAIRIRDWKTLYNYLVTLADIERGDD